MAHIEPLKLKQRDFQSSFTWNLRRSKFRASSTKQISISGLPFKWQLGMAFVDDPRYFGGLPAVRFDLDFIGDGPVPLEYTKISCDFKIGSFWTGKAVLFPKSVRQSHVVKRCTLKANAIRRGTLGIECRMRIKACFYESKPSELAIDDTKNCVTKLHKDIGVLLENERHSDLTTVVEDKELKAHKSILTSRSPVFSQDSRSFLKKLHKDIGVLLGDEKLSDVTIVVKDQEFKVHKLILAARSPVFYQMFTTDMKEKLESRIEIPDVCVEAVEEFLNFLYTAEVSPAPHLKDLLSLAALYQIGDLKDACGQMLITKLSKENALENLFIANLHNFNSLKEKSFEVITQQILSGTIPDHLMNKPEAVEKLVLAQLQYDETLQEVTDV